ncbi:hypothetical protein NITLEN_80087 [Nitrospira lenta]|uniref:Uncharacterized protein n=1 Tax=Nitrospira lenta TaxID=1436998 RepID=A0A330L9G4_9BACT|nr:hypothetical protein NITLEN_80087 [Nitrospira lenta]
MCDGVTSFVDVSGSWLWLVKKVP